MRRENILPALACLVAAAACSRSKPSSGAAADGPVLPLLARDAENGDGPSRTAPGGSPTSVNVGDGVVLLFLARDADNRDGLFQLVPGGSPTSVDVGDGAVLHAVASPGGGAAAVLVDVDGKRQVRVLQAGRPSRTVPVGDDAARVRAVGEDGSTVVVQRPNDVLAVSMATDGTEKMVLVEAAPLGRLRYGVALSADGSRLAFSAMRAACADSQERAETCPVGLYGVDLNAASAEPRPIAAPESGVSYDPQFAEPDGSAVLFLTAVDDGSDACRNRVDACTFALRRAPFAGGAAETVVEDGTFGRLAPDGTLLFRRREAADPGRSFPSRTLWRRRAGESPVQIRDDLSIWAQAPSPDSRWVAFRSDPQGEDETPIVIVDLDGTTKGDPLHVERPVLVGWSAGPLSAGERRLGPSRAIRRLRAALAEARRLGGDGVRLFGIAGLTPEVVEGAPENLADEDALAAWLAGGDGFVVAEREAFCHLGLRPDSPVAGLKVVWSIGDELVVASSAGAPAEAAPATPPLVGYGFPGGGSAELLAAEFPPSVRAGESFAMTLRWRVTGPVPADWKVFTHLDGDGARFATDHTPGGCGGDDWQPEQEIVDRFAVETEAGRAGRFTVWMGWFRGATRAEASGPRPTRDERVDVGTIELEPAGR